MIDDPLFQSPNSQPNPQARYALEREAQLPLTGWQQEVAKGLEYSLEAAASIRDRSIPTFSRGELPHFAGINTFLKAPYLEDVRQVGNYDVAIVGVPHDCGTTYRPGTRFGPQGIRRISALCPGTVRREIRVKLPERSHQVKRHSTFHDYRDELIDLLRGHGQEAALAIA